MENRANVRRISGIANARKVSMASVEGSDVQSVRVTDGFGEVLLSLSTSAFPAALTPEQAILLANELQASVARVLENQTP